MNVVEYNQKYKNDFIELNLGWINALFFEEDEDKKVLNHIEDYIKKGANVFFTLEDDEVLACCMIEPLRDDMWEISKFAARNLGSGKGAGSLCLKEALKFGLKHGAKLFEIVTNTKCFKAIHIYEKFGFKQIEEPIVNPYKRGNYFMEATASDILNKLPKEEVTELGNPGNPTGEAGLAMLSRMNESHNDLTAYGLSFLNEKEDGIYLDIGCGGGNTLKMLLSKTKNDVYGIDISLTAIKKSMEFNKKEYDNERLKLFKANVLELPFEENMFDAITTVESFYFWENHLEALRQIKKVLKDGGKFILMADIYDNGHLDFDTIVNISKYKLFNPTIDKFEDLFHLAGFNNIKIHLKENTTWIVVEGTK